MIRWRASAVLALGLWAGVAAASEFEGFRIPESRSRSYLVGVVGDWRGESRNDPGQSRRSSSANARLSGDYLRGFDSDRLSWSCEGAGLLAGSRHRGAFHRFSSFTGAGGPGFTSAEDYLNQGRATGESWNLTGSLSAYPASAPIGVRWSGNVSSNYLQSWNRRRDETLNTQDTLVSDFASRWSSSEWRYAQGATVAASVIFGRVRNATAIFQVQLLEERLRQDGVLLHPLSTSARQRLADLFALSSRFSFVHDWPDKFFWAEVERVLREDGALAERGLGAYAAQHAEDPLWLLNQVIATGGSFTRGVGWLVGPYVQYVHAHTIDRLDYATSTRLSVTGAPVVEFGSRRSASSTSSQDDCLVGGEAQYARPLGVRTQLDLAMSVSRATKQSHTTREFAFARIQHLIGERWLLASSVTQQRNFLRIPARASNWGVAGSAGATWYLEDFLSMNVSFVQQVNGYESGGAYSLSGHSRDVSSGVSLGLSFGRGRVDAPALSGPLTALN